MIGTILSHFRITDRLGQGGMGEVYKGEDIRLGRSVAVKVLPATSMAASGGRSSRGRTWRP